MFILTPLGHSTRTSHTRTRHGRALVECCVAAVLIATSATVVLLLGTTSAMLVNGAVAEDVVHRTLVSQTATLHGDACRGDASSASRALRQRYEINTEDAPTAGGRQEDLRVEWKESALHASAESLREHRTHGAASCE